MTDFTVADPDFAERVRHSFGRQGLMAHLCAVMTKVEPGIVEIEMPFTDELTQQHGFYHAGGIAAVVDTAGGFAGSTLFAADDGVLTVEFKLNLLSPADGDLLMARGEVIKPGRTLTITKGEVFIRKNGEKKLCALMQQTLMRIVGHSGIVG
ncbi:PaaI family thioesterase [Thalassospiraceae bacterium LMO-JJ14]|nr:PaaI family thioesterase [Thalassospiraceae bacterium LMO-JJ14]